MQRKHGLLFSATAAVVAFGWSGLAKANPIIDGTLNAGEGYQLVSTQLNVTNSPTSDNGNGGGPSTEVMSSNTAALDQISNAYAVVTGTGSTATLNLFLGGSISENVGSAGVANGNTDADYVIALQTNGSGVSSLNGQIINTGQSAGNPGPGNLPDVTFDTGFKPTALLVINPVTTGNATPGVYFTDLTAGAGSAPAVTAALNNSLITTAVGTSGNPTFTGANTGLELSIPLASLGYTDGAAINAMAFFGVGSNGRTNNQVIAPFVYNAADTSGGGDYTYIDTNEGGLPGRQFTGVDYPDDQYFTIPGVVPEPASLSLLAVAAAPLLLRRSRRTRVG